MRLQYVFIDCWYFLINTKKLSRRFRQHKKINCCYERKLGYKRGSVISCFTYQTPIKPWPDFFFFLKYVYNVKKLQDPFKEEVSSSDYVASKHSSGIHTVFDL